MISRPPYATSFNIDYEQLMRLPVSRRNELLDILKQVRGKEAAAWKKK